MHVHSHGKPADLACQVTPALDLIEKSTAMPTIAAAAPAAPTTMTDTAQPARSWARRENNRALNTFWRTQARQ